MVQRLQPDVVLPHWLPGLDGYEVARQPEACADLSAAGGDHWLWAPGRPRAGDDSGFDQHLTKPVDYLELQRALESRI